MKKSGFLMFALIGAIAMFSLQNCTKEDEGPANYFTFGETTYSLSSGVVGFDSSPSKEGIYENYIFLVSPEIQIILDSGMIGKGDGLVVRFGCTKAGKIEPGTYTFENKEDEPFSVIYGAAELKLNVMEESSDEYEFETGSITVKENNGEYEITWNFEDKDGTKIIGAYKGKLVNRDDVFPR